ncbi:MAG: hypothetical protein RLZZ490_1960 [Cyanobacteriota bacterium]
MLRTVPADNWLALMIGNSHLHWAKFQNHQIQQTWQTSPTIAPEDLSPLLGKVPFVVASVVPSQTDHWLTYQPRMLTLENIPLKNLYPTLGIDRALAALGAGMTYGFPCLVIDGGTALTLTAVDDQRCLIGGAILPGLGLQLHSLGDRTGALPLVSLPNQLPPRWGMNTPDAIQSGILYTVLAGLQDYIQAWMTRFPKSPVLLTGGDGKLLEQGLETMVTGHPIQLIYDPYLIFLGMQGCQNELKSQ